VPFWHDDFYTIILQHVQIILVVRLGSKCVVLLFDQLRKWGIPHSLLYKAEIEVVADDSLVLTEEIVEEQVLNIEASIVYPSSIHLRNIYVNSSIVNSSIVNPCIVVLFIYASIANTSVFNASIVSASQSRGESSTRLHQIYPMLWIQSIRSSILFTALDID
jgi:hypothetical protein